MPARPKRSERLKITLTPRELQQLQLAANTAKRPLATYAHGLLRQGLYRDVQAQMTDTFETADWLKVMGELYGMLDVVTQQIAEDNQPDKLEPEQLDLESLLNEIKERMKDIQQTLRLLPHPGEA